MTDTNDPITCPACGTVGSGRYCAECGAVLKGATCAACHATLAPGARFCHRCGTPVGAGVAAASTPIPAPFAGVLPTPARPRNALPWTLVGLAAVALVVILVAQRAATSGGANAAAPAAGATAPFAGAPVGGAPDISSMSPRERVDRLYDRIMRLAGEGKQDSVELFASMAIPAFEALGGLDDDARFDLGRVAEVSRNYDIAAAQADTILRGSPNHLLGLILAARVADARGDRARRDQLEKKLLASEASERQKALPEYTRHQDDIAAALEIARRRQR